MLMRFGSWVATSAVTPSASTTGMADKKGVYTSRYRP